MAKPIGPKTRLIREAIAANPKLGNTKLAALIMSSDARTEDKIKVTANDVGQQRVALKKAGGGAGAPEQPARKRARAKPRRTAPVAAQAASTAAPAAPRGSPVELIQQVFALAGRCGGMAELRRLVDCLAGPRV